MAPTNIPMKAMDSLVVLVNVFYLTGQEMAKKKCPLYIDLQNKQVYFGFKYNSMVWSNFSPPEEVRWLLKCDKIFKQTTLFHQPLIDMITMHGVQPVGKKNVG